MNETPDIKRSDRAVRASDAERERIAKMVSDAAGEGRLSLPEAEERLEQIYQTQFRHELAEFVTDLPHEGRPSVIGTRQGGGPVGRFPMRLRIHAGIAVALSVLLILRWVASGVPFFWPAGPMFFLWGSLLVHAMIVRRGGPPWARQWGSPPWWVERGSQPRQRVE